LFDPTTFGVLEPIVGVFGAEEGLKAACGVIAKNTQSLIFQRLNTKRFSFGGLYDRMTVRGSYRGKYVPSARVSGAPHLHLIEEGHRIVTPQGRDTGKRSKAFRVVADSVGKDKNLQRQKFIDKVNKIIDKELASRVFETYKTKKQAERYFVRILKRDVDKQPR